jgi:hypothetical protein
MVIPSLFTITALGNSIKMGPRSSFVSVKNAVKMFIEKRSNTRFQLLSGEYEYYCLLDLTSFSFVHKTTSHHVATSKSKTVPKYDSLKGTDW